MEPFALAATPELLAGHPHQKKHIWGVNYLQPRHWCVLEIFHGACPQVSHLLNDCGCGDHSLPEEAAAGSQEPTQEAPKEAALWANCLVHLGTTGSKATTVRH